MIIFHIITIHYFLWFCGQSPIFGFLSSYALHYANVNEGVFGTFNMILAFSGISVKPFFCSIADRKRAHREFFIGCLVLALIGSSTLALLAYAYEDVVGKEIYMYRWITICSMIVLFNSATAVIGCLTDTFAVNIAKRTKTSFGLIRIWGTIGWALSAVFLSYINEFKPYLFPGLVSTALFILVDIVCTFTIPNKKDFEIDESESGQTTKDLMNQIHNKETAQTTAYGSTQISNQTNTTIAIDGDAAVEEEASVKFDFNMQVKLLFHVAKTRPSLFRYLFLFAMTGALAALQWNYLFVYFTKIYGNDGVYFSSISMISQSLLGELPFFILAQPMINFLGRRHALSISIATMGLRYLAYAYLLPNSNGYFVLLSEIFQGPNFGLFYCILTSVGFDYADCDDAVLNFVSKLRRKSPNSPPLTEAQIDKLRQNIRSSMMSIASASYEGLGAGLGSLLGGWAFTYCGYEFVWKASSCIAITIGVLNSIFV